MFVSRTSLPRRTFLRGVGATVALPLLDAMVPALTAARQTAAAPVRRFGAIYIPHGATMAQWTPATTGAGFELSPILQPLQPLRDAVVVVSNLAGPPEPAGGGGHAIAPASWLTGANPRKTQGIDVLAGTTVDQVIARRIGQETPFPSLEVATEDFTGFVGACEIGYSCSYLNTIAWAAPSSPLPMETNPRVVFERMFGGAGTAEQRLARIRHNRSILDSIADATGDLRTGLGAPDRSRLDEYLQNIREIERRVDRLEQQNTVASLELPDSPSGVPEAFEEHVELMFDLLAVAFQSDITRVFTFMMARDLSNRTYPHIGVPDPHHGLSHHQNRPEKLARHARINTYHIELMARFLQRLRETKDGSGTLLDHSLILYGSGMSNANVHDHAPLPLLVAGGGAGLVRGGRHLQHAADTPLGNLLSSVAGCFGIEAQAFGETTGEIDL